MRFWRVLQASLRMPGRLHERPCNGMRISSPVNPRVPGMSANSTGAADCRDALVLGVEAGGCVYFWVWGTPPKSPYHFAHNDYRKD